jgi:CRISPR/Cas system-associated protein Csm6
MKRLIFTLTGISLLDEEKGLLGKGNTFTRNLEEIKNHSNMEAIITNNGILKKQKENVLALWAGKSLRDEISRFSAEIASLNRLGTLQSSSNDKIILIVSQTPECAFSGIVNGKFIIYKQKNNQMWDSITFSLAQDDVFSCNNVEIKIIDGLQVKNAEEFRTKGVLNLFDFVSKKMNVEGSSYDEIIFNITGGFKAVIPFATVLAFEKKLSLIYLYEESDNLIVTKPPKEFYYSEEIIKNTSVYPREERSD